MKSWMLNIGISSLHSNGEWMSSHTPDAILEVPVLLLEHSVVYCMLHTVHAELTAPAFLVVQINYLSNTKHGVRL